MTQFRHGLVKECSDLAKAKVIRLFLAVGRGTRGTKLGHHSMLSVFLILMTRIHDKRNTIVCNNKLSHFYVISLSGLPHNNYDYSLVIIR